MSENDYKIFEKIMSAHLRGIPKLHNSNDIKFQMNEIFPILSNELSVYLQNPIFKIELMVTRYLRNNQDACDDFIRIKFSGNKSHIKLKKIKF